MGVPHRFGRVLAASLAAGAFLAAVVPASAAPTALARADGCSSCGGVLDENGEPVPGATVTLYAAGADGTFSQVLDSSSLLAPTTRQNPEVTGDSGSFGWGVVDGTYRVVAQKAGCHALGDSSQLFAWSSTLVVPPGRSALTLRLDCGGSGDQPAGGGGTQGGGGGGGSGGGGGGGGSGGGAPRGGSGAGGGQGGTPAAPLVSVSCAGFGTPLRAAAAGKELDLATALQTSASTVTVSASSAAGDPLTLLPSSLLGTARQTAAGPSLAAAVPAAQVLPLRIRIARGAVAFSSGSVTVSATDAGGATTQLVLPFVESAGPPRLAVSRCGVSTLHARVVRGRLVVGGTLALDVPARLAFAASYGRRAAALQPGSRLGGRLLRVARKPVAAQGTAGETAFTLVFPRPRARGDVLVLRIRASGPSGGASTLALRFTG